MSSSIVYEVGDGTQVKFWQDQWCGESSLANCYPELFRICCNKEAGVADLMQFANGVLHWDLHFVQPIQDWELESLMTFMDIIYDMVIRGVGEDKMCWKPNQKKGFKISTFYHLLGAPPSISDQSFPWKIIWRSKVPLRVAFLYGLLLWVRF